MAKFIMYLSPTTLFNRAVASSLSRPAVRMALTTKTRSKMLFTAVPGNEIKETIRSIMLSIASTSDCGNLSFQSRLILPAMNIMASKILSYSAPIIFLIEYNPAAASSTILITDLFSFGSFSTPL